MYINLCTPNKIDHKILKKIKIPKIFKLTPPLIKRADFFSNNAS